MLISYVSTDNVKVGNLKAFDLVAFGRYPYIGLTGNLRANDRAIVDKTLQQVGMQWAASRDVCTLSDGERQRLVIARALAQDTPIIILDEPTAFLDVPNRSQIIFLLRELAEQHGKTIIFSTHDIDLSLRFAHQIWLMGSGFFRADIPNVLIEDGIIRQEFSMPDHDKTFHFPYSLRYTGHNGK
jgi:iron complex transport system ATP-binding protein